MNAPARVLWRRTLIPALSLALLLGCGGGDPGDPGDAGDAVEVGEVEAVSTNEDGPMVTLYFPGQDSRLYPEARPIAETRSELELAERVVTELLTGPENRALHPALSSEVELLNIELDTTGGTAWVDLGGDPRQIGGSKRELLAVYSFVQSLTENLDRIEQVVFLWNGIQRESFGGHVDTTMPLAPNPSYLAQQ